MIPYETHRIITTIDDKFALFTWGLIFFIAWSICGYFVYRQAKRNRDMDVNTAMQLFLVGFVSVLLGARVFHFFGPWGHGTFLERLKDVFMPTGGWVAYGGIIFGIIFAYLYSKAKKISFLSYSNLLAPAIPLGIGLGRFGCFLSGCCHGAKTDLPWAVVRNGIHIHPSQLYHALGNMMVFVIMLELFRRHKSKSRYKGFLIFSVVLLYSIARFITEFFREYSAEVYSYGFTFSQIISLALIFVIAPIMFVKHKKIKDTPIDKKTKKSYIIISIATILGILSTLFISTNFYPAEYE
ncbi:prolipoprotein diacylglyceryl transferase [candidate division KSB1 bacterium]